MWQRDDRKSKKVTMKSHTLQKAPQMRILRNLLSSVRAMTRQDFALNMLSMQIDRVKTPTELFFPNVLF